MRISLVTETATYHLAGQSGVDERVHSSAADFVITPQASVQVLQKIRAAHAAAVDRGNLLHQVSFSTTRVFENTDDAFLYSLDPDGKADRAGTLVFSIGSDLREMADAVVEPPSCRVIGCTVLLSYRASGGEITTPGPPP